MSRDRFSQTVNTAMDRPDTHSSATPRGDRGAVLPLVLVMVVIGSLIVLPVLSYATTVMRANSVLSVKTQRFEAVKSGLRTALYDPLDLFRECEDQAAEKMYARTDMNGVEVNTTCQIVGYGTTVIEDHLRYGLVATEVGQTVPVELKGQKFTNVAPDDWLGIDVPWYDDPLTSLPATIWLPDLPSYSKVVRTRVQGYDMPAGYAGCKVYFPGTYVDDVVLTGPTFFTSGIYYFEGEVRVEGGADVVVGDGRHTGCATSQEAVFFSQPPLPETEPHSITGFGATWLFGGEGRLVVDNDNGNPINLVFNRRYVDDPTSDPSLFVSIASVNGEVTTEGVHQDLAIDGMLHVPISRVMVAKDIYETTAQHDLTPSSLTATPRPPEPPVNVVATAFRTSSSSSTANNGGVYVTWEAPPVEDHNGSPIHQYEVAVDGTPRCTIDVTTGQRFECLVTGLRGVASGSGEPHAVEVRAYNERGASSPVTSDFAIKNGSGASPALHAAPSGLSRPSDPATADRFPGAIRVTFTPATNPGTTPIASYTVTAERQSGTGGPSTATCTVDARAVTPTPSTFSCIVRGLTSSSSQYKFRVAATNLGGGTVTSSLSANNRTTGTATDPGDPAPPVVEPVPLPDVPPVVAQPIVDIELANSADATIRIPGYVAVPQGTFRVNNPHARGIEFVGGILAARFDVADGRVAGASCTTAPSPPDPMWVAGQNCVDLGFESENVQKRLRIVSTTPSGVEKSVAIVQVNENGAYAVNSWEVQ